MSRGVCGLVRERVRCDWGGGVRGAVRSGVVFAEGDGLVSDGIAGRGERSELCAFSPDGDPEARVLAVDPTRAA